MAPRKKANPETVAHANRVKTWEDRYAEEKKARGPEDVTSQLARLQESQRANPKRFFWGEESVPVRKGKGKAPEAREAEELAIRLEDLARQARALVRA